MPARRLLPDIATLTQWRDAGLTHAQIVDRVQQTTGQRVSRSTVSSALSRAGRTAPRPRHRDTLPWRVRPQHAREYPARMLRLLGRRRRGLPLDGADNARLDRWLARLTRDALVVGYIPDRTSGRGFVLIPRDPRHDDPALPIRRDPLTVDDLTGADAAEPRPRPALRRTA